jgi:hypothetical protein
LRRLEPVLVKAGIGAQIAGRAEIRDQQVNRPVALGLNDQFAFEFERRAEQHRQCNGFGEQPGDRLGISVPAENRVDHRTELDNAAAHIQAIDLEGQHTVIAGDSPALRGVRISVSMFIPDYLAPGSLAQHSRGTRFVRRRLAECQTAACRHSSGAPP